MRPTSITTSAVLSICLICGGFSASAEQSRQAKGFFAKLFSGHQGQTGAAGAQDDLSEARNALKQAVKVAVDNRPTGRLWCVPFARAITGVALRGNARTWWDQAAGKYARGQEPEIGAVLSFSGSKSMPKGHVAVVSAVLGPREILVDHANWQHNQISLDNRVVDVSPQNDWSQVRVANAGGSLGRVNPVQGFIYTDQGPKG
jgi:hypothetical protein